VERGDRRMEKSWSGMWKADTVKAIALPVSIKDRWVGPHEQVMNVPITCWCYGPGKSSSWMSTEAYLFPTASLVVVGENLGTNLRIQRSSSCGLCQELFFSGAVDLYKSIDDFTKG
jgi:hypothetical protein